MTRTYSTSEIQALTGLSRERLRQLRAGYTQKRARKKGAAYVLRIPPKLILGEDWGWSEGVIFYTRKGLRKLMKRQAAG